MALLEEATPTKIPAGLIRLSADLPQADPRSVSFRVRTGQDGVDRGVAEALNAASPNATYTSGGGEYLTKTTAGGDPVDVRASPVES